jgi:hypothetical protein
MAASTEFTMDAVLAAREDLKRAEKRLETAEEALAANVDPAKVAKLEKAVDDATEIVKLAMATVKELAEALKEEKRAATEAQCLVTAQGLQQLKIAASGMGVFFAYFAVVFLLTLFSLSLPCLLGTSSTFSSKSVAENYRTNTLKLKIAEAASFLPPAVSVLPAIPLPPLSVIDRTAKEFVVQAYMESVAAVLNDGLPSRTQCLIGTATTVAFATRKPDMTAYVAGSTGAPLSRDVTHITIIGELKRPRDAIAVGKFGEDEKGQTLSLAEDLVKAQLWRAGSGGGSVRVMAFLSDGLHIIFFKCMFAVMYTDYGVNVELREFFESPPKLLFDEGLKQLAGLLSAPPSDLGHCLPRFTVSGRLVTLNRFLGLGATSAGFCGEHNGRAVVVKQYRRDFESGLEREVLEKLREQNTPGVVHLVGVCDTENTIPDLVLEPVGVTSYSLSITLAFHLTPAVGLWRPDLPATVAAAAAHTVHRPTGRDYCDLVDALANLHAAGFVHRDPRPANFFRTVSGHFFLADVGAAVRIGTTASKWLPCGFHYGPMSVLEAMVHNRELPASVPEHDFEQVARLVFYTANQASMPAKPSDSADVLVWWDQFNEWPVLKRLLESACGTKEQFKASIRDVLFF